MDLSPSDFAREPGRVPMSDPYSDRDIEHEKAPPRDMKRTVLIGGLGVLSWVATYVGMLELIEANMGELPLIHKLIVGFSVAMLMTMIIWLLDQMFKPQAFVTKLAYASGYVFLSIISIGFGFGFYWKVLESRGEASRSAESAVTQVQSSLQVASTRLEQLQSTLMQLTALSTEKANLEQASGTSCPNSRPGDGPRRRLRNEDAEKFSFAADFVTHRVTAVKSELAALDGDLAKIATADPSTIDAKSGTRNEFMKALGRKLDLTATTFNAFRSDPQLSQIRGVLAERAERTSFPDERGRTFSCPDAQLQTALRGVVKAIDQLPVLETPKIAAVEGSEATIEAFRRLTATFYGALAFKLPPSADDLRELQKKAVQSIENPQAQSASLALDQAGLSKRDYVPLAVAVFVDLCLLLVSMVARPTERMSGLIPRMRAAERGPVIQILSRFNEIHRDKQIRENFEIFRHVVFDMHGDYYVAVPLDAPVRMNPEQREALRVEAQLLSNLFASFEKEKIFKRVMLPTASSIRKRLARQGSKFAGSEGFRVYKFADGAWSDIILGAIMGAAKRIETEARTRTANQSERLTLRTVPTRPQTPPVAEWREPKAPSLGGSGLRLPNAPSPGSEQDAGRSSPRFDQSDEELNAQFGIYAPRRRAEMDHDMRRAPAERAARGPRARTAEREAEAEVSLHVPELAGDDAAPAPKLHGSLSALIERSLAGLPVDTSTTITAPPADGVTIVDEPTFATVLPGAQPSNAPERENT